MRYYQQIIIASLLSLVANLLIAGNMQRKQLIDDGWVFNGKEMVCLPHDWSARMAIDSNAPAGNDGGYYPTGIGIYHKVLTLTKDYEGKKIWLYFEGVYQASEVTVNGKAAGGHPYGYSSFWCDITTLVKIGKNDITVKADNSKQKNCRWYSGSGIYRHVWLVTTEPVHIDNWGLKVTTPDKNMVVVETDVRNETNEFKEIKVRTELSDGTNGCQTVKVEAHAMVRVKEKLRMDNPRLWSPSHPHLYTVKVSLSSGDTMTETFGIRTIEYAAEKGLLLNGEPMVLNGGCVHHDNGILGAAAFDKAEIRKVILMKDAGYNAVRTAHNPPSESFLNACDSIGLLVIDEAFDGWREKKNEEDYHQLFDLWYAKDIEAMVRRDRNHPSIFCWSIGNEVIERKKLEVVTTAHHLKKEVHRWDTTRPVTSALASWDKDWEIYDPLAAEMDITGYNYMIHEAEGDHQRIPSRVMMQTESYPRDAFSNWAMTADHQYIIGDFVWTAIDYLGESGIGRYWYEGDTPGEHWERPLFPWHAAFCGDIDLTGRLKPIGHYRNMLWQGDERLYMAVREPHGWNGRGKISAGLWAVHPSWESWNWEGWEGRDIDVVVCSRYPNVRLYLNDRLIGEKTTDRSSEFKAVFTIPYTQGTLKAVGVDNGKECETTQLTTAGKPFAIKMTTEDVMLKADGQDLAFVRVEVVDKEGRRVPNASNLIRFAIKGAGEIQAIGNADITELTPFTAKEWKVWKGELLVVVRSGRKPGTMSLSATSEGQKSGVARMKTTK
ncbi:MAG: glycoside hydrolase family 2 TIM barrel-domain containing protein [Prevotella sp.]|nr:glycoside hydrolase family 2 TIM barrel-domain containing protein [Prevotella sp.]